jgi:hypothetical protein
MSSFKQSALSLTNKATSVAPTISGDLTIVARNGKLVTYDGTTDNTLAYTSDISGVDLSNYTTLSVTSEISS